MYINQKAIYSKLYIVAMRLSIAMQGEFGK